MTRKQWSSSSRLVLAMMLPVALAACGSSASAPNAAAGTAAAKTSGPLTGATAPVASTASMATTEVGGAAGTAGGGVATAGGTVAAVGTKLPAPAGPVVTATGDTITATGQSLENGALDEPAGVTVVDSPVTDTAANNLANASVLSNTPASNAPVQANAAANGQVASASVAQPGNSGVPVVSPLMAGSQTIVGAAGGGAVENTAGLSSLPSQTGALAPGLAAASGAAAPLNPALNAAVGGTQVVGSPGGSALSAGVLSGGKLVNAGLTTPAGVPNPVDAGVGALTGGAGTSTVTNLLAK